jgi:putative two-component system response regulator
MKTHARLGYQALVHAEEMLGAQVPFLRIAKEIALCHHEKWDGSGYPNGLAGDAIPVSARLMAVADVYDAVISRRVYKSEMSHETAVAIICEGAGRHFDPDVAATFNVLESEFEQIAQRYADTAVEEHIRGEKIASSGGALDANRYVRPLGVFTSYSPFFSR